MTDMRVKYIPPAVNQLAFNCPHCGALAKQFWFSVHAEPMKKDGTPLILDAEEVDKLNFNDPEELEGPRKFKAWAERMAMGLPFLEHNSNHCDYALQNVHLSRCFNCNDVAIWLYNRLLWPQRGEAPLPNPDLPDDIRRDYEEASSILDLSPRGATALLRLAIQKLCRDLGEKGKNIDDDIAALVKKGLDPQVQQALDVVRVIGNNAVHPGQINLRDDRATAENLFGLVNLITTIMISQPKHIQAMYAGLPEGARKAIEKRDGS